MCPAKIQIRLPSAQSDHSLRCLHGETLGPFLSTECTAKTGQTGRTPRLIWAFAEHTWHFMVLSCGGSCCITTTTTTTATATTATTTTAEQCLSMSTMPGNYLRFNFTAEMLPAYIVAMANWCCIGFLVLVLLDVNDVIFPQCFFYTKITRYHKTNSKHENRARQKTLIELPGSATITNRSHIPTPRGRETWQKPNTYKTNKQMITKAREAQRPTPSSLNEVTTMLKGMTKHEDKRAREDFKT